jgi:hypothetical protein
MYFNAQISVIIADKELKTVVSVSSKNDSCHIGAECSVVVPINCRIQYTNGKHDYLTDYPKNLFSTGDPITIKARYVGYDWVQVFTGFVVDFIEGTPLEIRCADYVYWLNQGIFGSQRVLIKKNKKSKKSVASVGTSYQSITLKNLLQNLIDFTNDTIDHKADNADHLQLINDVPEFTLVNVTFAMMSPAAILDWLKKNLGFNISLSGSQLYCNVASNTLNVVKYRTDRNVIGCDLQKPHALFQSFKLKAWFLRQDGTRDSVEVGDPNGVMRDYFFMNIPRNETIYLKLANEALLKVKQEKYNGSIDTLLYPDCQLFDKANYVDIRYPDRSANYVITGVDFEIGENGYHRKLKLSFLSEIQ